MIRRQSKRQAGFALLIMLVVLIGVASLGLSNILGSSVKYRDERNKMENINVLQEAKEALLSYTVDYAVRDVNGDGNMVLNRMGRLPCPDITDTAFPSDIEGNQDSNCGVTGANSIGYLPFKTLGIGKIEGASKECLWYVVSGDYKNQPSANLLNWDSLGYLNLVDENGKLKHDNLEGSYPIAFIINPGAAINQDRGLDPALPECKANYTIANYLEGGPNINYDVDLPLDADTLWEILTTPASASLDNLNYNDRVIAIYRDELWGRVKQIGDLSFDNATGVAAMSKIELLTKSLAECIAAYGNDIANLHGQLPYPAPVDLDPTNVDQNEYRNEDNYDDSNAIRYGRFPQDLDDSFQNETNFVYGATSYCEASGVTAYNENLWNNWKDHFFYIVSEDFDSNPGPPEPTPKDNTKCTAANCITINGGADKVAAMVLFAGEAQVGQNRIWWWDEPSGSVGSDFKSSESNYLETSNEVEYIAGSLDYTISNPAVGGFDYQYCVEYQDVSPTVTPDYKLVAIKCSNLDGVNGAP